MPRNLPGPGGRGPTVTNERGSGSQEAGCLGHSVRGGPGTPARPSGSSSRWEWLRPATPAMGAGSPELPSWDREFYLSLWRGHSAR